MSKFESVNPWTPAQEAWLLKESNKGVSQAKLYRQLSGKMPGLPEEIPVWNGTLDTFKKRMQVLNAGNSAGIRKSKKDRAAQKVLAEIDLSNDAGMLTYLESIIKSGGSLTPDQRNTYNMIRELRDAGKPLTNLRADQIRLQTDPSVVTTTPEGIADFILTFRGEVSNWIELLIDSCLTKEELEAIRDRVAVLLKVITDAEEATARTVASTRCPAVTSERVPDSVDMEAPTSEPTHYCAGHEKNLPESEFYHHTLTQYSTPNPNDYHTWCKECQKLKKRGM